MNPDHTLAQIAPLMAEMGKHMKLSIIMMYRDEGRYLKEWIEFHLMVGVEHFYLYDRMSTDNSMAVLQPYIEQGIVDVKYWPRVAIDAHGVTYSGARTPWSAIALVDLALHPKTPCFDNEHLVAVAITAAVVVVHLGLLEVFLARQRRDTAALKESKPRHRE